MRAWRPNLLEKLPRGDLESSGQLTSMSEGFSLRFSLFPYKSGPWWPATASLDPPCSYHILLLEAEVLENQRQIHEFSDSQAFFMYSSMQLRDEYWAGEIDSGTVQTKLEPSSVYGPTMVIPGLCQVCPKHTLLPTKRSEC